MHVPCTLNVSIFIRSGFKMKVTFSKLLKPDCQTSVELRDTVACVRESTKPILCSKWGHFERSKPILKILLSSWTLYTVENGFRSFTAKNLGSVGQKAAKLLAIKLCACTLFGLYCQRVCKRLRPRFENARGQIILKVWWPVPLQPFNLQIQTFKHWKI